MAYQDYQWAFGFSLPGSLTNVEDDVPAFQGHPFFVKGLSSFSDGIKRERADGHISETGIGVFTWLVEVVSFAQYNYSKANYTVGGVSYSGDLTVRTLLKDNVTYANYNATLQLPRETELTVIPGLDAYSDVVFTFSNAVAI